MSSGKVWVISPFESWRSGICRYLEEVFPNRQIIAVSTSSDAEKLTVNAEDVALIHKGWIAGLAIRGDRVIPVYTGKEVLETDLTIYDTGVRIASAIESLISTENTQDMNVLLVAGGSKTNSIARACADALASMKKSTVLMALTPQWNGQSGTLGYQELLYRAAEGQVDFDMGRMECCGSSGFYQPVLQSGVVALEDWSEQVIDGLMNMFQNAGVQFVVVDGGHAVGRAWRNWCAYANHVVWTQAADPQYMTELSRWANIRACTQEWFLEPASAHTHGPFQNTILYHPDVLSLYGKQEGVQILRQMGVITG